MAASRLRSWWFRVLGRTLNPIAIRSAKRGRSAFSVVKHVGRKTGTPYETPIIVARVDGGWVAELTYGDDVAWYRNTVAAHGCTLVVDGVEHEVSGPEPLSPEVGLASYPRSQRGILKLLRRRHFVLLRERGRVA